MSNHNGLLKIPRIACKIIDLSLPMLSIMTDDAFVKKACALATDPDNPLLSYFHVLDGGTSA